LALSRHVNDLAASHHLAPRPPRIKHARSKPTFLYTASTAALLVFLAALLGTLRLRTDKPLDSPPTAPPIQIESGPNHRARPPTVKPSPANLTRNFAQLGFDSRIRDSNSTGAAGSRIDRAEPDHPFRNTIPSPHQASSDGFDRRGS
jgi:hypothetical protein